MIFRRLKNNVTYFFYKQQFYKQHLGEIWFGIVAILRIKRSQKKNKRCNWKTRWVKSITSTKSLPYKWKVMLTPFTIDHPPIWPPHTHTPTPILSKIYITLFYDFSKLLTLLQIKGGRVRFTLCLLNSEIFNIITILSVLVYFHVLQFTLSMTKCYLTEWTFYYLFWLHCLQYPNWTPSGSG